MNRTTRIILALLTLLLITHSAISQDRHCGTEAYGQYLELKDPSLKHRREAAQQAMIKKRASSRIASIDTGKVYRIPVVVHVIWNTAESNISDEVIYSQIQILNQDYRRLNPDTSKTFSIFKPVAGDTHFEFFLAGIDPFGNPSTGIARMHTNIVSFSPQELDQNLKPLSYWPSDQYLNLWVTTIDQGYLGVGPYPSDVYNDSNLSDPKADGVVINYKAFGRNAYKYNLGRTATHEIGHWLGLYHIWGDSNDDCGSDMVEDTPLQKNNNQYMASTCPAVKSNCTGVLTQDMANNYMDYSPDQCMNIFTVGQGERMHFVMENNQLRKALQASPAVTSIASTLASHTNSLVLNLFPNPAKNLVTLDIESISGNDFFIRIFDALGQNVFKQYTAMNQNSIDISFLRPGIYQIIVETQNHISTQTKLICVN